MLRHRSRSVILMDRVYEHITLPPLVIQAIDTPVFQRLRGLKQLGVSSYLYPGAVHTRFEHSIGVAHLASQFMQTLQLKQPSLGISEEDITLVMLAGLAHDLGHGPFSHLFEDVIVREIAREASTTPPVSGVTGSTAEATFSHEAMSQALMRVMLDGLASPNEMDAVGELMSGTVSADGPGRFAQIISNKRSGVDVDRIDYFVRDSLSAFGKPHVDVRIRRLFNSALLVRGESCTDAPWELAFEEKMALTLRDLFALRAKLHKSVYQHHVVKCIGHMIGDALRLAAAGGFRVAGHTLLECVSNAELFLNTGDWILEAIEHSTEPAMQPARSVLERLRRRVLYPLVLARALTPVAAGHPSSSAPPTSLMTAQRVAEAICSLAQPLGSLHIDDIIVDLVVINHGCGSSDPLLRMYFFNPKAAEPKLTRVAPNSSPLFSPVVFEERTLLIFVRDQQKVQLVKEATARWEADVSVAPLLEPSLPSFNASL